MRDDDGEHDDEMASDEWVSEATVVCPHCGETVSIAIDPAGGDEQDYVEDCEVCCRPWQVHVERNEAGGFVVRLEGG